LNGDDVDEGLPASDDRVTKRRLGWVSEEDQGRRSSLVPPSSLRGPWVVRGLEDQGRGSILVTPWSLLCLVAPRTRLCQISHAPDDVYLSICPFAYLRNHTHQDCMPSTSHDTGDDRARLARPYSWILCTLTDRHTPDHKSVTYGQAAGDHCSLTTLAYHTDCDVTVQWRNKVAVGPRASIPKGPPLPKKNF